MHQESEEFKHDSSASGSHKATVQKSSGVTSDNLNPSKLTLAIDRIHLFKGFLTMCLGSLLGTWILPLTPYLVSLSNIVAAFIKASKRESSRKTGARIYIVVEST